MVEDSFAGKAAFFARHYETGRGRICFELVLERLLRRLPPPPASVLDAGGGTGAFAIPLAARGYDVTILDPSPEWLGAAGAAAEEAGVAIRLLEGRAEDALSLVAGPFDAVLCHTVLIYADDPLAVLLALRRVASPGAVLSSLEKNCDALPARPAREGRYEEALRLMDDPWAAGRLGIPNRALAGGELRSLMVRAAWLPERWAGIRVYSDGAPDDLDPTELEAALELDRKASTRDPHRRSGRLLHVLARAWEPESLGKVQERSIARAAAGTRESWPPEQALNEAELDTFLERKRYAALSTTRPDGRPHATMVAYCVRDGRVWLPAVRQAQRVRNVASEPSATLLVTEGEGDEHVALLIEGQVAVREEVDALLDDWLREEWSRRYGTLLSWADTVVELLPTKVLSHRAGP